ncbi:hypothetical protein MKW92_053430 [Papaver armeniacum]|nr:hypothetical protein MKW92_053430 [Papaver armeniacum]
MGMESVANSIVWDVIPGLAMVLMEGITVGLTIMTKTVMARGMSPFVFIAYTNILSTLILLPSFFFFHRPQKSFLTFSLLSKFFFLGLIGVTLAQNFAFMGLSYSSPIVVATMANQLPGFSFLLSMGLRCGQVGFRRTSTQAKSIGTVVSIVGAVFVATYKGPTLWKPSTYQLFLSSSPRPLFLFGSTPESWVLGCILLAIATLCASVWNIIQVKTVKEFPEPTTIVTLYSLFGTIQCVIISVIAERDPSAWLITDKMELSNILLSAFFGSIVRSTVQGWCMRTKGPLFIAMFKPFTVFIAVSFGFMFFGHTFHFGSVIGSFIAAMGYYCSMWGQVKEVEENQIGQHQNGSSSHASSSSKNYGDNDQSSVNIKTPLLQDAHRVQHEEV